MTADRTPCVRTLIVCDGIRASNREDNVFHLRGARYQLVADSFPWRRRLRLFAVLSIQRPGRFPGYVKILNDQTDQAVFYGQIEPSPMFPDAGDLLPLDLPIHPVFRSQAAIQCNSGFSGDHGRRPENGTTL